MSLGQVAAMPSSEYETWREFYEIEPWGLAVQDSLAAGLATLLANVHRDPKARPKPFQLKEFRLFNEPAPEAEGVVSTSDGLLASPEQHSDMVLALFAGMNVIRA